MAKKNKIDTDNFEPEKEAKPTPNRRWFDFIFDERFHKSIGLSFILILNSFLLS